MYGRTANLSIPVFTPEVSHRPTLVIPTGAQRSGEPALSEVEWGPAVSPASMGLSCPLHNLDKSAQRVVTVIR